MSDYTINPDSNNSENDKDVIETLMQFCGKHGYGVIHRDVNDWVAIKFGGGYRTAWPTRASAYEACLNKIMNDSWVEGTAFTETVHE